MGTELSVPVVVKRFEAVVCGFQMNGTTVRTTSPGLYRIGREYPRADVSGHATSRCKCGTGVRLALLLFDTPDSGD